MKKVLFPLLLIALLFSGCNLGPNASPPPPNSPDPAPNNEQATYPEPVMDALEATKNIMVGTWVVVEDETFVIASYGQQPTAGYEITITEITPENDRLQVTVALTEPTGPVAQVISHPYAVEVVPGVYEQVDFVLEGDYFPQVYGLEEPLRPPLYQSDNIYVLSFNSDETGVTVTGIARVFEATVSYELQDQAGDVLETGFTTAASGGPDWGYYTLSLDSTQLPPSATALLLYQESAKDGSKLDKVPLPLQP